MTTPRRSPLERLLSRLALTQLDRDLFLGEPGRGQGRLFGGLVAAQSLVAACGTVAEGAPHSLHAYFLRPGSHETPIRFVVDRIRDGRTFTTRRVVAHQGGEAIFSLEASFARTEAGIAHQDRMPEMSGPDGLPDWETTRPDSAPEGAARSERSPLDIRAANVGGSPGEGPIIRQVWMRPKGELPEDPTLHAAVITFASDRGMLSTVARFHGLPWNRTATASLDHAIWFHRPPRWDGWLLYTTTSHAAHGGRALIFGTMFGESGDLMASIAQEGLFRAPRSTSD